MSIEKVLKGGGVQGHKGDLFKALSRALLRSVQDKVANVFQLTLQVIIICAACLHVKSAEFLACTSHLGSGSHLGPTSSVPCM